jgi:hypothetical protein
MKTAYKWILGLGIGYVAYRIWKKRAGKTNPISQGIDNFLDSLGVGGGVLGTVVQTVTGAGKPEVIEAAQQIFSVPSFQIGGVLPIVRPPSIPTPIGGSNIFGGLLRNVRKRR